MFVEKPVGSALEQDSLAFFAVAHPSREVSLNSDCLNVGILLTGNMCQTKKIDAIFAGFRVSIGLA